MSQLSRIDRLLVNLDTFIKSVVAHDAPPLPRRFGQDDPGDMAEEQKRETAALMRVNHVGEVCAQALYRAQALTTANPALQKKFDEAAQEETVHLDWTRARIEQLGGRPSLLNPLWYAGAFGIGLVAGRMGDKISLGFMAETERQVEEHLESHLQRLPAEDSVSRKIVQEMKDDEARHATQAIKLGGMELPPPAKLLMRAASKLMTTVAHRI
jgi:ubiquinone biosynthesis monooxygenase Coq7